VCAIIVLWKDVVYLPYNGLRVYVTALDIDPSHHAITPEWWSRQPVGNRINWRNIAIALKMPWAAV
jgi:hypothetical protein